MPIDRVQVKSTVSQMQRDRDGTEKSTAREERSIVTPGSRDQKSQRQLLPAVHKPESSSFANIES